MRGTGIEVQLNEKMENGVQPITLCSTPGIINAISKALKAVDVEFRISEVDSASATGQRRQSLHTTAEDLQSALDNAPSLKGQFLRTRRPAQTAGRRHNSL